MWRHETTVRYFRVLVLLMKVKIEYFWFKVLRSFEDWKLDDFIMTKFILIYTMVNHERPSFDRHWPRTVHDFTTDWSLSNSMNFFGKIGNFWLNKGTVLRVRLCKITQLLTDFFQNNFPVGSFVKMTFEEKKGWNEKSSLNKSEN